MCIRDSGHCKTIAHCDGTRVLLEKAGVDAAGEGVVAIEALVKTGPRRHWSREPQVRDLA